LYFKSLLLFILIFCVKSGVNAQKISIFEKPVLDSTYIKSYIEKLVVRPNFNQKVSAFNIEDQESELSANYLPNAASSIGLAFTYKWVGLGFSLNLPYTTLDETVYGKTQNLDLQAFIFPRKFFGDINLQYYQGYYLANPKSIIPLNQQPLNFGRSDIKTINITSGFYYVFNNTKFSFRSFYMQNERQVKSAGSFLTGINFSTYSMSADSTIIPLSAQENFIEDAWISGSQTFTSTIKAGYAHTFVVGKKKDLTLSFLLIPGVGFTNVFNQAEKGILSNNLLALSFKSSVSIAKFWGNNTFGFYALAEEYNFNPQKGVSFAYNAGILRLFYSRRIAAPKLIKMIIK